MNEPRKKFKIVTDKSARVILPNTLTLIGVCIGLTSINFALNQNFKLAIVAIVCAAIIDGLDGRIARLIKGTSKVGKELDSLTDIISFGVAPAFIMYFWTLNTLGKIGWLISLIYVVCVALRLARFNINTGGEPSWRDNFFQGVPSPAGGILVLSPLVYDQSGLNIFNYNIELITPIQNSMPVHQKSDNIPKTARSYRATVLDDNAVVSINLKWLAQIGALLAMLVYGYWNMVTRITNLEQEVADADAQIEELVEKHIEEEGVRYTEMEKQLKFYEKEFNINPLSWGRKKKRK